MTNTHGTDELCREAFQKWYNTLGGDEIWGLWDAWQAAWNARTESVPPEVDELIDKWRAFRSQPFVDFKDFPQFMNLADTVIRRLQATSDAAYKKTAHIKGFQAHIAGKENQHDFIRHCDQLLAMLRRKPLTTPSPPEVDEHTLSELLDQFVLGTGWIFGEQSKAYAIKALLSLTTPSPPEVGDKLVSFHKNGKYAYFDIENGIGVFGGNMPVDDAAKQFIERVKDLLPLTTPSQEPMHGHNEPCYYCGKPCDKLAGNPGLWPILLCHRDEPGVPKWHHSACISSRLEPPSQELREENERLKRELADLQEERQTAYVSPEERQRLQRQQNKILNETIEQLSTNKQEGE